MRTPDKNDPKHLYHTLRNHMRRNDIRGVLSVCETILTNDIAMMAAVEAGYGFERERGALLWALAFTKDLMQGYQPEVAKQIAKLARRLPNPQPIDGSDAAVLVRSLNSRSWIDESLVLKRIGWNAERLSIAIDDAESRGWIEHLPTSRLVRPCRERAAITTHTRSIALSRGAETDERRVLVSVATRRRARQALWLDLERRASHLHQVGQ